MEEITIAIIGLVGMVTVALIQNRKLNSKFAVEQAKRDQQQEDLIKQLLEKVEQHNHYAKRFESVDRKLTIVQQDIKYLKRGIHINE